jgi:MFS family permease
LDIIGVLLLSPAFSILIIGISKIRSSGGIENIGAFIPLAIGIILLIAFIVYGLRAKIEPVIDLHLFKLRTFSSSTILLFISGVIITGTSFILPLFFQQIYNYTPLIAGLLLAPQGIGMLFTRGTAGKLTDKIGSRLVVLISLVLVIIGTVPFVFANTFTHYILLIVALLIRGAGLGGVSIPIMVSIYDGLTKEQVSHGTIATRIFQQIGGAFGTAILAIVFHHQISVSENIENVVKSYNVVFLWSIGFTVISIIPSLFLPVKKDKQ